MFCTSCGRENDANAKFCEYCGVAIEREITYQKEEEDTEEAAIYEMIGIAIALIGFVATIYFVISINNDRVPYGLAGIMGNYKPPFSEYEKSQITKLVVSMGATLTGIHTWIRAKNKLTDLGTTLFLEIVAVAIVFLVGLVWISN